MEIKSNPHHASLIISGELELQKYLDDVSIYKARSETEKVFTKVSQGKIIKESGYYAWALHDIFFYKTVSPYLELRSLIEKAAEGTEVICIDIPFRYSSILQQLMGFKIKQTVKLKPLLNKLLLPFLNLFLLFYSLLSYLISIPRKKLTSIWTGDYLGVKGLGDPRIADIYLYLKQDRIPYLEFIRTSGVPPRKILFNMMKRKRPAIYQDCLENLFSSKKNNLKISPNNSVEEHLELLLINLSGQCLKYKRSEFIFDFIFKTLNINTLICWFLSHRTFSVVTAAKKNKIKTIGFMHGVSVYHYMGHEYMKEYSGNPIGPDKFGVWSEYWLKQFQKHSSIYAKDAVEISGPMKKNIFYEKNRSTKEFVTIISEQSSEPQYIINFVRALLDNNQKVMLKVRQFGDDPFYRKFKQLFPEVLKKIKISFAPVEDVFNISSVVLGTHSTAVIEASMFLVPFAILDTIKWQDYFEIEQTSPPYQASIRNNEDLLNLLNSISQNDYSDYLKLIRKNYFGDKNGLDWIKQQIP